MLAHYCDDRGENGTGQGDQSGSIANVPADTNRRFSDPEILRRHYSIRRVFHKLFKHFPQ